MPSMYHEGSYPELERVLHEMRDGTPSERRLWWSVGARYLWCAERIARVACRRTRKGPVVIAPEHAEIAIVIEVHSHSALVRVREWSRTVMTTVVDAGVREIAERMYGGDHGRVILPRELMRSSQ